MKRNCHQNVSRQKAGVMKEMATKLFSFDPEINTTEHDDGPITVHGSTKRIKPHACLSKHNSI